MAKNVVVVGAQWGDEGKGKIVDWLTEKVAVDHQRMTRIVATIEASSRFFKLPAHHAVSRCLGPRSRSCSWRQ